MPAPVTFSISHHAFGGNIRGPRAEIPTGTKARGTALFHRPALGNGIVWRSQMRFAMSHDAVPPDRPADAYEPSPAKQLRISTTATLLALAVCAILAKGHLLETRTSSHSAAVAQNAGTAPVTIVAP